MVTAVARAVVTELAKGVVPKVAAEVVPEVSPPRGMKMGLGGGNAMPWIWMTLLAGVLLLAAAAAPTTDAGEIFVQ